MKRIVGEDERKIWEQKMKNMRKVKIDERKIWEHIKNKMLLKNSICNDCINNSICKYKSECEEIQCELLIKTDNPFTVTFKCKKKLINNVSLDTSKISEEIVEEFEKSIGLLTRADYEENKRHSNGLEKIEEEIVNNYDNKCL